MKAVPGSLREGGAPFHPTRWSVVLLAAQSQSLEPARAALREVCQQYWPPLYAFVRRRGYSSSDAQDCVQAFFAHLLEADTLRRADREKGRLRTFLLGSLQHFMAKEHARAQALKRGGGRQIVPLDNYHAEAEAAVSVGAGADEVSAYDLAWAAALTRRAWERLRRACVEEGREELAHALEPFFFVGSDPLPNQEEVAARLELPVATLRTHLHRLRGRYRESLRAEVAQTVAGPADVEAEMRHLYRVLTG